MKLFLSTLGGLHIFHPITVNWKNPLFRYHDWCPCLVLRHIFSISLSLMLEVRSFSPWIAVSFSCICFLWISPFQTLGILAWNVKALCTLNKLSSSYLCFPSNIRNFFLKSSFVIFISCHRDAEVLWKWMIACHYWNSSLLSLDNSSFVSLWRVVEL